MIDRKTYFSNLDDIKFVDPNVSKNNKLAFSIPLFESGLYRTREENLYLASYNSMYTKAAIWSAMSFLWCSNLGSNGVKFYFHVEDKVADIAVPYLREHGVPEEYIRVLSLPPEFEYDRDMHATPFGKKFMWMFDDNMDALLVSVLDSDFFLCTKAGKQDLYRDLTSPILRDQIALMGFRWVRFNYGYKLREYIAGAGLNQKFLDKTGWVVPGGDLKGTQNFTDPAAIERACFERYGLKYRFKENVPASDYVVRPTISTQFIQVPTHHEFVEFIKEYGHQCYQDEGLFSMYFMAHASPIGLDQLLGVPRFLWQKEWDLSTETYFAHYMDNEITPEHPCYADFYKCMMKIFHNLHSE